MRHSAGGFCDSGYCVPQAVQMWWGIDHLVVIPGRRVSGESGIHTPQPVFGEISK